ncbi:hypothetical protein JXD38_11030 [candidate division WOR-3 bacterium]|nr:hypothetical protein [candidate division WOR-3 bacterium]
MNPNQDGGVSENSGVAVRVAAEVGLQVIVETAARVAMEIALVLATRFRQQTAGHVTATILSRTGVRIDTTIGL